MTSPFSGLNSGFDSPSSYTSEYGDPYAASVPFSGSLSDRNSQSSPQSFGGSQSYSATSGSGNPNQYYQQPLQGSQPYQQDVVSYRDRAGDRIGLDYTLTPEETRVMKECRKESFYYRCLPLMIGK